MGNQNLKSNVFHTNMYLPSFTQYLGVINPVPTLEPLEPRKPLKFVVIFKDRHGDLCILLMQRNDGRGGNYTLPSGMQKREQTPGKVLQDILDPEYKLGVQLDTARGKYSAHMVDTGGKPEIVGPRTRRIPFKDLSSENVLTVDDQSRVAAVTLREALDLLEDIDDIHLMEEGEQVWREKREKKSSWMTGLLHSVGVASAE